MRRPTPIGRGSGDWEVRPLTEKSWGDFEELFGARGACGGCWCMYWMLRGKAFAKGKGEPNRKSMSDLVKSGSEPGLLGYSGGEPVAWCALAPRERYPRLEHSKTLARLDDEPVWSVVCFFVRRGYRRGGLAVRMLEAAATYAREHGATCLEGYPVDVALGGLPDAFVYTGTVRLFARAGFRDMGRRSKSRPIFRLKL